MKALLQSCMIIMIIIMIMYYSCYNHVIYCLKHHRHSKVLVRRSIAN